MWIGFASPSPLLAQEHLLGLGPPKPDAEEPTRSIAPTSSPGEDRALAKRLAEIYAEVEGLEAVEIEFHAGVVKLSGEVFSSAGHDRAVRIANQLQGVVTVQDEIRESQDLTRRMRPIVADVWERLLGLMTGIPLFAVSVAVFVLFIMIGRWLSRWEALFRRISRNVFARELVRQAVRVAFLLGGAVVALEILDATALFAAVAGVAGLAGLAISFAFRDLVENYIASVLLSLRQPFQADDHVVISGYEGRVVRLTSRATILMTLDGNHVRIPNADVYKGILLNYSRNPERRFGFAVGVAGETDLARAVNLGVETLEQMGGVLAEPSAAGWVEALADWTVVLRFSAWIDQRETDWFKARGEGIRLVKEAFETAGIVMPLPVVSLAIVPERRSGAELEGAEPAPDDRDLGAASTGPEPEVDISRDTDLESALAEDRAAGGNDLLDASRPLE
jgi:small-conductance mechanosensitive channel